MISLYASLENPGFIPKEERGTVSQEAFKWLADTWD